MFKNRTARIGILFGILILALGAVGIGSALWSETLTIDGDVLTGNVDVEFGYVAVDDLGAAGECTLTGTPDALTMTMTGVYPTYECYLEINVLNVGSIPVLVDEPVWTLPAEITYTHDVCYGDGYLLDAGVPDMAHCTLHFTVGDVAQSSVYTFHGDVLATQVTLP